jgi:transcription antitermination factor NusB
MSDQQPTTKEIYSKKILQKRLARLIAVQALYAQFQTGDDIDQVIFGLLTNNDSDAEKPQVDKANEALLVKLARGTYRKLPELKTIASGLMAENWRFERLPLLIQAILVTGIFEIRVLQTADLPILINEYLEIAKFFNHEAEVGFVNTVLEKCII